MKAQNFYFPFIGLILLLEAIGCSPARNQYPPVFLYEELQDSVENFVLKVLPTIEKKGNRPLFTIVIFRVEEKDTLVIISSANTPFVCHPETDTILGNAMLNGHICEVVYSGNHKDSLWQISGIVNESGLNITTQELHEMLPPIKVQNECDYRFIEEAAESRRFFILNRPNHLISIP